LGRTRKEEAVNDPGFITNATGDPYKVPQLTGMRKFEFESYLKFGQEKNFTPAKVVTHNKKGPLPVPMFNAFEHIPEGPPKKRVMRNPETKEIDV